MTEEEREFNEVSELIFKLHESTHGYFIVLQQFSHKGIEYRGFGYDDNCALERESGHIIELMVSMGFVENVQGGECGGSITYDNRIAYTQKGLRLVERLNVLLHSKEVL